MSFSKPGIGSQRGLKHQNPFSGRLKRGQKWLEIIKKHDFRCVFEEKDQTWGGKNSRGLVKDETCPPFFDTPLAGCSLKQMTRGLSIHQVESSSDEFPSCANCDRNEKTPMFFCNTCGQFFTTYLRKTTPKFASSPA